MAPDTALRMHGGRMAWHAIECSEHAESFVSSGLTALGLDVCLPRILKRIKMPRGKVAEILEPLFPGYVLCAWEPGYERGRGVAHSRCRACRRSHR
jgi:hypothetical protein